DRDDGAGPEGVEHERKRPHLLDVGDQVPGELPGHGRPPGSVRRLVCRPLCHADVSGWPTTISRPSPVVSTSTGVPYSGVGGDGVMTSGALPGAAPPWPR